MCVPHGIQLQYKCFITKQNIICNELRITGTETKKLGIFQLDLTSADLCFSLLTWKKGVGMEMEIESGVIVQIS